MMRRPPAEPAAAELAKHQPLVGGLLACASGLGGIRQLCIQLEAMPALYVSLQQLRHHLMPLDDAQIPA